MAKSKTPADDSPKSRVKAGAAAGDEGAPGAKGVIPHFVVMNKPATSERPLEIDDHANVELDMRLMSRPAAVTDDKKPEKANVQFEVKPFYGRRKAKPAPSIGSMQVPGSKP